MRVSMAKTGSCRARHGDGTTCTTSSSTTTRLSCRGPPRSRRLTSSWSPRGCVWLACSAMWLGRHMWLCNGPVHPRSGPHATQGGRGHFCPSSCHRQRRHLLRQWDLRLHQQQTPEHQGPLNRKFAKACSPSLHCVAVPSCVQAAGAAAFFFTPPAPCPSPARRARSPSRVGVGTPAARLRPHPTVASSQNPVSLTPFQRKHRSGCTRLRLFAR